MKFKTIIIFVVMMMFASTLVAATFVPLADANFGTLNKQDSINVNVTITNNDLLTTFNITNIVLSDLSNGIDMIPASSMTITPTVINIIAPANDNNITFGITIPGAISPGTYTGTYTINYTDGITPVLEAGVITVDVLNRDLDVTGITSTTAVVGVAFTDNINVTDLDGDILTYSASAYPGSVNPGTGALAGWTPTPGNLPSVSFDAYAEDGFGGNDTQAVVLSVVSQDFDLGINLISINVTPSFYVGQNYLYSVEIINNGPNVYDITDANLNINFGDGTSLDFPVPGILVGSTYTINAAHVYATAANHTLSATLSFPSYLMDINSSNDVDTANFDIVIPPTIDITMPADYTFTMYRGDTDMQSGILTNVGTDDVNVTLSHVFPVSSFLSPTSIIDLIPAATENVELTFSSLTAVPGIYTGTVFADYVDALGTPIQETSNITLTVLNYLPTIASTSIQAIENNAFSATFSTDDGDNDPVSVTVMSNTCTWATVTTTSISGIAPDLVGTTAQTCTVSFELDDSFETVTRNIIFTTMPDLPYVSVTDVTFDGGRDATYTEYIAVTNTGVQDLTNINIDLQGISSSYNAVLGSYTSFLAVGDSMNVAVDLYIPDNIDSGLEDVGNIYITADGNSGLTTSDTSDVYVDAESFLSIENVAIDIDGEEDDSDSNVASGQSFDIYQNDEFTIEINFLNDYTSSSDPDIENIYFEMEADDNDFNIEIDSKDYNEEIDKLEAGDDEELKLSFTIDTDGLEDGDATNITITAFGEDEEGNFEHQDTFSFELVFNKVDDKITITNVYTVPSTITCEDNSFVLYIEVTNEGYDDQDGVYVNIDSDYDAFWLDEDSYEVDNFDEGDTELFSFTVPTNSRLTEGMHTIDIIAYYGSSYSYAADFETLWVDMNAPGCATSAIASGTTTGTTTTGTSTTGTTTTTTGTSVLSPSTSGSILNVGPTIEGWITSTSKQLRLSTGAQVALWALLGAVVIAAIVLALVAVTRRRDDE